MMSTDEISCMFSHKSLYISEKAIYSLNRILVSYRCRVHIFNTHKVYHGPFHYFQYITFNNIYDLQNLIYRMLNSSSYSVFNELNVCSFSSLNSR